MIRKRTADRFLKALAAMLLLSIHGFGAAFPTPYNTELDTNGPIPAAAAASQFALPKGFSARVMASEPEVQNPIAMCWDSKGRLWVAENYTYAEAPRKFDLGLRDRILIFEDAEGTGKFTSRKVFADELQMLTSIEIGHGGVWAMCPPQLIFIPLGNNDLPSGAPQVVLDGFMVPAESYHNFANGLRWGPDGWLYGRCGGTAPGDIGAPGISPAERVPLRGGMWRYHPKRKIFEALNAGTTNPWGHDWDKFGELFFINTVNGHLWHSITGAHYVRGSSVDPNPRVYGLIDQHADHWHFDTAQGWMKSRDGAANTLGGGHAHIGALIYQGDNWPRSFRDNLYTFNMHGLRVNREILERNGSGYVARHGEDFLLAADKWFRGIDLSCGPDGGVLAIDWSDTGECHERNGVHRTSGRIFKIQFEEPKPVRQLDLPSLSVEALAKLHLHENEWYVRQARRVLADRASAGTLEANAGGVLKQLFQEQQDPALRLRLLWTLYAVGLADEKFLVAQLDDANEHVRTWGVRLISDTWGLDSLVSVTPAHAVGPETVAKVLPKLVEMAEKDTSGLVRLSLASVLQRLPLSERAAVARELVRHKEDADDHNLPLLVWYGMIPLSKAHADDLVSVAKACEWPTTRRMISRCLSEEMERQPSPLNSLLELSIGRPFEYQKDVLSGVVDGLKGWRKASKPAAWDRFASMLGGSPNSELAEYTRQLSALFGDGRALEEIKALAMDKAADLSARKSALQTLIENKPADLRAICEELIGTRFLNSVAARGLALFDDPAIGERLVKSYSSFHLSERPQLVATLVSRASFIKPLLAAIGSGKISKEVLSVYEVRQIREFKDAEINTMLARVWGELRETAGDKKAAIETFKAELTAADLAMADRSKGRSVFKMVCETCHTLYGEGGKIGPDLTGAGRDNLDYLLENIVDPSAVVGADFRMNVVRLKDGRVLSGMLRDKTDKTLSVQTMTEKVTFERDEIAGQDEFPTSMMPEGLLDALTPVQRRDLIAYLIQKTQVPLPVE